MIDQKKIQEAVVMILEAVGEDPTREGLLETPARVGRMYAEIFSGLNQTAEVHLSKTFAVKSDDIVIERDIPFYSMCEHHLLPFYGKVHIAYIPNGRVAGLSKLVRTVDLYSKRPQLQEVLTTDIGEAIMEYLHARGVMVIIEAEHLCMNMRGVKRPGTRTVTAMQSGIFQHNKELKDEVHKLLSIK